MQASFTKSGNSLALCSYRVTSRQNRSIPAKSRSTRHLRSERGAD